MEGRENANAEGDAEYEEEYLHIDVKVPMGCPTPATADDIVTLCSTTAGGDAPTDYLDALTVASDMLVRHERGGSFARRVMFITDLCSRCDLDEEFVEGLAASMRAANVQLVVAVVGEANHADHDTELRATIQANRAMFSNLCTKLNAVSWDGARVPTSSRSAVEDAAEVLLTAQVKHPRPTTTFRGTLELTPWLSLKVWVYKKVAEMKAPPMKRCADDAGAELDEVVPDKKFISYANPDAPEEVRPEMLISAYPYGPMHIPIHDDVRQLMVSKSDKGMKIFGFTPLNTVPHWYGMEEARVLVPWPDKETSMSAGMAATAGCADREAGKAVVAMSALARAMQRKGVAALTRAVWSQNSDKVTFGALMPHIVPEGDFLLFVPMPYAEDMYSSDFKPLPVPGSDAARQLSTSAAAKLVPTEEQRTAAAALVDSLDGAGLMPWRALNPGLSRTHALIHARTLNDPAWSLTSPAGCGPEAAAALTAPPMTESGLSGRVGSGEGGEGAVVPTTVVGVADAFLAVCGGLKCQAPEAKGAWRKRGREDAAPAEVPNDPAPGDRDPRAPAADQRRQTEGGGLEAGGSAAPAEVQSTVPAGGGSDSGAAWNDGDAWVHVVKEEPMDEDGHMGKRSRNMPETQVVEEFEVEPPPTVEEDDFWDDMD